MKLHLPWSVVVLSLLAASCATPLENRHWVAIQTEHFQFLSDDDAARSVQLARDFEAFHSFMEQMTGGVKIEPRIPTLVYLFADQATYRIFAPPNSLGFYNGTPRANYIAVGKGGRGFSDTLVPFHEYSHFLMGTRGLFGYPMWYDEGHADFVGAAEVRDGKFELGRPIQDRLDVLGRVGAMPLKSMITAKDISEWGPLQVSQLYATGWCFVHYMYNSAHSGQVNRWAQKDRFLALLNKGIDPEEAFTTAFGTDFKTMERELAEYMKDPSVLQVPIARFGSVVEPTARPVDAAEALTRLGELLLSVGEIRSAERQLARALELDPAQPRARSLLARALGAQGRHEAAEAMFAQALAQESGSALAHLDYGLYLASRSIRRNERTAAVEPTDLPLEQRSAYLQRGRTEYERAIALDPSIPEAYTELAFTYLAPGEPAAQAVPYADTAFALLPSDDTIALQLAEVLIAAGKFDEARPLLTRLLPEASRSKPLKAYLDILLARVAQAAAR